MILKELKKQLLDGAATLFERANKLENDQKKAAQNENELYKSIGQLQVENEFLKKSTSKYRGMKQIFRSEDFCDANREAM